MDKWKLIGFIGLTSLIVVVVPLAYMILNPPAKDRSLLVMRQKNRITPALIKKLVAAPDQSASVPATGVIAGFEFFGDAQENAGVTGSNEIVLTLNRLGWLSMSINFAAPVSLRDNRLVFQARGRDGAEKLQIGVTDTHRWTTHKLDMLTVELGKDWKEIVLDQSFLPAGVDSNAILLVKLSTESEAGKEVEIILKDIVLVSQKRP